MGNYDDVHIFSFHSVLLNHNYFYKYTAPMTNEKIEEFERFITSLYYYILHTHILLLNFLFFSFPFHCSAFSLFSFFSFFFSVRFIIVCYAGYNDGAMVMIIAIVLVHIVHWEGAAECAHRLMNKIYRSNSYASRTEPNKLTNTKCARRTENNNNEKK